MSFPIDRRGEPRRAADRAVDDLQKTFKTCLERIADGILLLDSETRVLYATPQADQRLKKPDSPIAVSSKLALRNPRNAARFAAFVNDKNQETGPLSLLLEGDDGSDPLLLTCFRLPPNPAADVHAACYLVTLRDPNRSSGEQWLLFQEQFRLTPADVRLCRALADGLTLSDYSEKWHIAISTARGQLSDVFAKTATRRQSDLLRLIFLFTRN